MVQRGMGIPQLPKIPARLAKDIAYSTATVENAHQKNQFRLPFRRRLNRSSSVRPVPEKREYCTTPQAKYDIAELARMAHTIWSAPYMKRKRPNHRNSFS